MPKCPACKKIKEQAHFHGLPLDQRCVECIPSDIAMVLYDKRVQEAGQTVAAIFDASDQGVSLRPLETMVALAYDAFGGPHIFMRNVVQWIEELSTNPRTKGIALTNAMKLLGLHAKVDRMRLDEDFKRMDDETLRATLKIKLMALATEAMADEAKAKAIKNVLGGDDDDAMACGVRK